MTTLSAERIGELVVEALERTAFVLVDIVDDKQAKELPPPSQHVRVQFSGAACGSIILSATEGFLLELASSILGVEASEVTSEKEGKDALGELSNIVGGSVILELGGEDRYIKYGLPSAINESDLPEDSERIVKCYFECEGELLVVTWQPLQNEQAAAA